MLRFNLEKLPAWVPDIGTVVEICPVGQQFLPHTALRNYRAKVISVAKIGTFYYQIQLEEYGEKIMLNIGNDEAHLEGWFFDTPVHLSF